MMQQFSTSAYFKLTRVLSLCWCNFSHKTPLWCQTYGLKKRSCLAVQLQAYSHLTAVYLE